jgi:hypothetical protein
MPVESEEDIDQRIHQLVEFCIEHIDELHPGHKEDLVDLAKRIQLGDRVDSFTLDTEPSIV